MQPVLGTDKHAPSIGRPLLRLTDRNPEPPRVRRMLEAVLARSAALLEPQLVATLDEFELHLFRLAEKARNNETQHSCLDSLREVKRGRAEVVPRFMQALENSLARTGEVARGGHDAGPSRTAQSALALIESAKLEESLALQEIATKAEIRQSQGLYALGQRFGVLAGAPQFDPESLPLGPSHLGAALRHACANLGLPIDHRLMLYRTFDRTVMLGIGSLYDALNAYLVGQRILRNPVLIVPHPKREQAPAPEAKAADAQASVAAGSGHHSMPTHPRRVFPAAPAAGGNERATASASGGGRTATGGADERDAELFTTLRELLAGRRNALGPGATGAGRDPVGTDGHCASDAEVQAVLGELQSRPALPAAHGDRAMQRSVAHLKQDLLGHLQRHARDGRPAQLEEETSDTIDLVGMLFDYISKSARPNGSTQALLTRLQVPLLRVALQDKSFFTRRSHPARQLLNAIAETGMYWVDEGDGAADRALTEKMQLLVDRVSSEYDGNLGLFEELFGDLSRHMTTLANKAQVAERRHVDAARGREKLDVARETASNAIAQRLSGSQSSKLVRAVLEHAWTDVLALTLLRQGEQSETYKRRLDVADQLLSSGAARKDGEIKPASAALRLEVEAGLGQVGYHHDDIQAVVKTLFRPKATEHEENPSSQTELALNLKNRAHLGGDIPGVLAQAARGPRPVRAKPVFNAAEAAMFYRIKTLPFGTWFEFVTNQQGDTVRRKLAWYSTVTGHCLFVTQRGAHTDERTLEAIARLVVRGQARIVEPEHDSLIDRAWQAIAGALRQFARRAPDPIPSAAG